MVTNSLHNKNLKHNNFIPRYIFQHHQCFCIPEQKKGTDIVQDLPIPNRAQGVIEYGASLAQLTQLEYSCAKSIEADIYPLLVTPKHCSQIFHMMSRMWTIKPRTRAVISAQGVTEDGHITCGALLESSKTR